MLGENTFAGGANVQPGQGTGEKHLAEILLSVKADVQETAGIKGLALITAAAASPVAAADATDLATLLTLANEEKSDWNVMVTLLNEVKTLLNPLKKFDIVATSAVATTLANATDEATAVALVNDLKAKYNVGVTLVNEIKTELNTSGEVVISAANAVAEATANATNEATAITLANALKASLNVMVTLANEIRTDVNAIPRITLEVNSI